MTTWEGKTHAPRLIPIQGGIAIACGFVPRLDEGSESDGFLGQMNGIFVVLTALPRGDGAGGAVLTGVELKFVGRAVLEGDEEIFSTTEKDTVTFRKPKASKE